MIQRIAIDGACRRNGKPDCVAAGGVFIRQITPEGVDMQGLTLSNYEVGSTSQRGEMIALLTALDHTYGTKMETQIVTDSEYLFNAMTKDWLHSWNNKGWITSMGEPVKNQDIWKQILNVWDNCEEVNFYHIKGHCIPFGKVTARESLITDSTGVLTYALALNRYKDMKEAKTEVLKAAQELSMKNNGFYLDEHVLEQFVTSNLVADAVATRCVELADACS